jgi:hypothetical protein
MAMDNIPGRDVARFQAHSRKARTTIEAPKSVTPVHP